MNIVLKLSHFGACQNSCPYVILTNLVWPEVFCDTKDWSQRVVRLREHMVAPEN